MESDWIPEGVGKSLLDFVNQFCNGIVIAQVKLFYLFLWVRTREAGSDDLPIGITEDLNYA